MTTHNPLSTAVIAALIERLNEAAQDTTVLEYGEHWNLHDEAASALSVLAEENKRLRKDAERYRLVRTAPYKEARCFIRWTGGDPWLIAEDDLDAKVDALLAQQKENKA